jgi:hypothetical protein
MLSGVRSSKGRSHGVEASHTRQHNHNPYRSLHPCGRDVASTKGALPCALCVKDFDLSSGEATYFFLTFVPIRNNFLTVPVGSRFI